VKIDIARLGTDAFTMLLDRMVDGSAIPSRWPTGNRRARKRN
jgi:hypothetical protein